MAINPFIKYTTALTTYELWEKAYDYNSFETAELFLAFRKNFAQPKYDNALREY